MKRITLFIATLTLTSSMLFGCGEAESDIKNTDSSPEPIATADVEQNQEVEQEPVVEDEPDESMDEDVLEWGDGSVVLDWTDGETLGFYVYSILNNNHETKAVKDYKFDMYFYDNNDNVIASNTGEVFRIGPKDKALAVCYFEVEKEEFSNFKNFDIEIVDGRLAKNDVIPSSDFEFNTLEIDKDSLGTTVVGTALYHGDNKIDSLYLTALCYKEGEVVGIIDYGISFTLNPDVETRFELKGSSQIPDGIDKVEYYPTYLDF